MSKIKFFYALNDIPSRIFILTFDSYTTMGKILEIVSERSLKTYSTIFLKNKELDAETKLQDVWSEGAIFVVSTEKTPPDYFFYGCIYVPMDIDENSIYKSLTRKFNFYFTGGTKDMLFEGIEVELDTSMNPNSCRDKLQSYLKGKIDLTNKQLLVYLPGGIPFIAGTLDIFFNTFFQPRKVIYGVVTRCISDDVLNTNYPEICNVSDPYHRLLISPLVDSTDRGLSDIACLMGYLNHDGYDGDLLLRTCASVVCFPPLITSMNRIIERNQVTGRDIVAVCSTLYTYFRAILPPTCPDKEVLEYGLRICNLISHIENPPEKIPIEKITKFPKDFKLGPIVYFWRFDIGDDFQYNDFELQDTESIENAYNLISTFTPIAPLSIRSVSGCSIVKGKTHEYLYLMQSPSKDYESQNKIQIIDPMTGMSESIDVEKFAKEQINTQSDDTSNLIDPDRVKQIIMVNFDESKSMTCDLTGIIIPPNSDKDHRVTIAYQYLTTFTNRMYGYRMPCIQGLVSFNNKVVVRCPLSPLVEDFEDKGLKSIRPDSITKLWDSLQKSCDEIVKFRKDEDGNEIYKNATSRILVISGGEDVNSTAKVEDVVKDLMKNKIIVDSVIISSEDECKMLCAVSQATGGFSFRPETVIEGLSLFEQSAFLNIEERMMRTKPLISGQRATYPSRLKPEQITSDFMEQVKDNAKFDTEIRNRIFIQGCANVTLTTPLLVCAKNMHNELLNSRVRRILHELHSAADLNDEQSPNYDPDMKIYTFRSNLDIWRVFIKGPVGTPYADMWWYLYVTFPGLYPVQPPEFRFISVPYHLNVSEDGRICHNIIEKGYISSKHVIDIIQEIKEIFLLPNPETPIQIKILDTFLNDFKTYQKRARESAEKNAKQDYKDYIDNVRLDNDIPPDFEIEFKEKVPPFMISQISGKKIDKDKLVMASSGVYYDRDELKQIISSSKTPICVITGKYLTEKPEDLDDTI